jgi:hypothetical protein
VVLATNKANYRAWGLTMQLLALTNSCQEVLKARQPATAGWLTANAPSKSLTVIPPDYSEDAIHPQDPRQPAMVQACRLLDIACQMLSMYPAHPLRIARIHKKRAARLLPRLELG